MTITECSFYRKSFVRTLVLALMGIAAVPAFADSVTLTWDPPTTNEDGSALNDLAGYRVYYGDAPGMNVKANYKSSVTLNLSTTTTINNLSSVKTYYFAVTAYDIAGNESVLSEEKSKAMSGVPTPTPTLTPTPTGTPGDGSGSPTPTPGSGDGQNPAPGSGAGTDPDGDQVDNGTDNCPDAANSDQLDSDHDGVGDACENSYKGTFLDFDGDGLSDVAFAQRGHKGVSTHIILSNGSTRDVDFGDANDMIVPADYDGDGRDDIAIIDRRSGKLELDEDVVTTSLRKVRVSASRGYTLAGCDFNGDGKADIANYNSAKATLSIKGTAEAFKFKDIKGAVSALYCDDLNGDGHAELMVLGLEADKRHVRRQYVSAYETDGSLVVRKALSGRVRSVLTARTAALELPSLIAVEGVSRSLNRLTLFTPASDGSYHARRMNVKKFSDAVPGMFSRVSAADLNSDINYGGLLLALSNGKLLKADLTPGSHYSEYVTEDNQSISLHGRVLLHPVNVKGK